MSQFVRLLLSRAMLFATLLFVLVQTAYPVDQLTISTTQSGGVQEVDANNTRTFAFSIGASSTIVNGSFVMKVGGNVTAPVVFSIKDSGGTTVVSQSVPASSVTGSYAPLVVTFPANTIPAGNYTLVITSTTGGTNGTYQYFLKGGDTQITNLTTGTTSVYNATTGAPATVSPPAVTVTSAVTTTSTSPITYTVTTTNGGVLDQTKLTTGGTGTIQSVTDNGNGTYTVTVIPTSGTVTLTAPTGSVTNSAGSNTAASSATVTYTGPTAPPGVTVTSSPGTTSTSPITYTITTTNGGILDPSQLVVSGGTIGTTTNNGDGTYTVTVVPTGDGPVTLTAPAGSVTNTIGNNTSPASATVTYSGPTAPPSVTVSSSTSTTSTSPITYTVTTTNGGILDPSQLVVTGGTIGTTTNNGDGTYTVTVIPSGDGPVTLTAPAGSVSNTLGTNASPSTASVTYSGPTGPPGVTVTSPSSTSSTSPIIYTVTTTNGGTLDPTQLVVTGGTIGTTTNNGDGTYTVSVIPSGDGPVNLTVPAGAVSNSLGTNSSASSATVTYSSGGGGGGGGSSTAVPEPSTISMLLLGGFATVATKWRRRRTVPA